MEPLHYVEIDDSMTVIDNNQTKFQQQATLGRKDTPQTIKMDRNNEVKLQLLYNYQIIGLVDSKKSDNNYYKESYVIETIPAITACALISVTFFCCGCPK